MSPTLMRLAACLLLAATFSLPSGRPASAASATTSQSCLPASIRNTLAQIRQKFGPISVVSTYRPGARIAGSSQRSLHAGCRAVDFHPPKGKYQQVLNWLRSNHGGGLGTYSCGMHHLHIDNGPKVRFHHCVNAWGRPVGKSKTYAFKGKSKRKSVAGKSAKKRSYAQKKSRKKSTLVAAKLRKKSYAFKGKSKRKKSSSAN